MDESEEAFEAAVRGIALHLLAEAFADLADAYVTADPERGHRLLHDLQHRTVVRLKRFAADNPGMARPDILGAAAGRVRTVLREAQGEGDG